MDFVHFKLLGVSQPSKPAGIARTKCHVEGLQPYGGFGSIKQVHASDTPGTARMTGTVFDGADLHKNARPNGKFRHISRIDAQPGMGQITVLTAGIVNTRR